MNPLKTILLVGFLTCTLVSFGQLNDDFSDGDFTQNPEWLGDTHLFIVNEDKMLQLFAPAAGAAQLVTAATFTDTVIEWRFRIKLSFAPSANNYARLYLAASDTNLMNPNLQAFYLQFGESLSNDAIELFYQNGNTTTSILRGYDGFIASAFDIQVKMVKDKNHNWLLYGDKQNQGFDLQAVGHCPLVGNFRFLGLYCLYTASNKEHFFFDDFYCGAPRTDYVPPQIGCNDIIISELMADPTPTVQLPDAEYIELYNRLPVRVKLNGWKLKTGNTLRPLPELTLDSAGFALLTAQSHYAEFTPFVANVYPLNSLSITDGGQQLTLYNERDEVIFSLNFKKEWHRNALKQNGGWSLEMIDTDSPCMEADNWNSSIDERGGTPCQTNSIAAANPDIEPLHIEKITVEDSLTFRLFFTKPVITDTGQLRRAIQIDRAMQIQGFSFYAINLKSVAIYLTKPLAFNILYTLTVTDTLSDCAGNLLPLHSSVVFGRPQRPEKGDVVINELLYEPRDRADADYVELYNRSEKIIDLRTLLIGNGSGVLPTKAVAAVSDGFLLFPKHYVALCKSPKITKMQYFTPYPENLVSCDSLPAYGNSGGTVHLTDRFFNPIDRFDYLPEMHYALLTSHAGVALERIHFEAATQNANNWTSAAAGAGFGTPGYCNSQFSELLVENDLLSVIPPVFSPDGDGFEDYTEFCCHFAETENRVTLAIYDRAGGLVKMLVNNQLCGAQECFRWDGDTDRGSRATPQIYIVKLQYWNISGKKKSQIKAVGVVLQNH